MQALILHDYIGGSVGDHNETVEGIPPEAGLGDAFYYF
jgi:hypothetical protein